MSTAPIEAVAAALAAPVDPTQNLSAATVAAPRTSATSFSGMLLQGIEQVNRNILDADAAATAFSLDDSIPLHQVTFALEQSRISFELMMQARNRLTEAYQEMLRMQL